MIYLECISVLVPDPAGYCQCQYASGIGIPSGAVISQWYSPREPFLGNGIPLGSDSNGRQLYSPRERLLGISISLGSGYYADHGLSLPSTE